MPMASAPEIPAALRGRVRILRDPLMQQKLCLWLAVAVLFGALLAGNPFLVERVALRARPVVPARDVPADVMRRTPGTELRGDARGSGGNGFEATPALAVALSAPAPADASVAPLCPDLALRPLVVDVVRDANGEPVWVLRDGSRRMRNPKRGAGQPLLVAVEASAAPK